MPLLRRSKPLSHDAWLQGLARHRCATPEAQCAWLEKAMAREPHMNRWVRDNEFLGPRTVLDHVVLAGLPAMVQWLIERGANPNASPDLLVWMVRTSAFTLGPDWHAALRGATVPAHEVRTQAHHDNHRAILDHLFAGGWALSSAPGLRDSAWERIAECPHLVTWLVDHGHPVDERDDWGDTWLHSVARKWAHFGDGWNSPEECEALLAVLDLALTHGAPLEALNESGQTPTQWLEAALKKGVWPHQDPARVPSMWAQWNDRLAAHALARQMEQALPSGPVGRLRL